MYDQARAQQPADRPRGTDSRRRDPGPDQLLPPDERDKIALRLGHALNTFPDTPRQALEEAEGAFDEVTAQLMHALAERRRLLRATWQDRDRDPDQDQDQDSDQDSGQDSGQDPASGSDIDELRLALRQYRETTHRLLRL